MAEKCSKCRKEISIWEANYVDKRVFCDKCRKGYTGEKDNKKRGIENEIIRKHPSKEYIGETLGVGILFLLGSIIYSFFMYSINYTFIYGIVFGIAGLWMIISSIYKFIRNKMKKRKDGNKHTSYVLIFLIIITWIAMSIFIFPKIQHDISNESNQNESNFTNSEPNETTETTIPTEKINDQFSNAKELHWTHMPLTYNTNFSTYSPENKKSEELNVKYAFERIHNAIPYITFIKTEKENPDILFVGQIPLEILSETENAVGLSIPNYTGKIINNCLIYISEFLKNDPDFIASYPSDDEVHEIIHCFGIGHSNVIGGIMWPVGSSFPKKIEDNIISCLKNIYSNELESNCSKVNFYKACEEGYLLGEDYECHKECGDGFYCKEGSICQNGGCYGCEEGYYLNNDNLCYPKGVLGNLKFFFHSGESPISFNSTEAINKMGA